MNPPLILFPHEPFSPGKIDSVFVSEYEAARVIGFPTGFYDHEAIESGRPKPGLNCLPDSATNQRVILRGWMVPGEVYAKDCLPLTSPRDYEQAHYIPFAYPLTEGYTPRTAWNRGR